MSTSPSPSPPATPAADTSQRNVPMRVLSLGLPRTGTASMQRALTILGYANVAHGFDMISHPEICGAWEAAALAKFRGQGKRFGREEFDALLGTCEAVTDGPCALFWEELMDAYPEASIILVERDIESWYTSFTTTVIAELFSRTADLLVNYIEPLMGSRIGPLNRLLVLGYFRAAGGSPDEVRQNARRVYTQHYAAIREKCEGEQPRGIRRRLLEYSLGEGWEPLCRFLGREVPDKSVEFPRVNEAEALRAKIREVQVEKLRGAGVVLGKWGMPIAVVGLGVWWAWR